MVERHRLELAVEVIGPAVIAAGELRRVALLGRHHHGAAVGALVVHHVQRAVVVAHHHHRLAADLGREIVAGIFHLALVADIDPGRAEQALHLQLEDRRIGVDLPVHRRPRMRKNLEKSCVMRRDILHGRQGGRGTGQPSSAARRERRDHRDAQQVVVGPAGLGLDLLQACRNGSGVSRFFLFWMVWVWIVSSVTSRRCLS